MKQPYFWIGVAGWIILGAVGKLNPLQAQMIPDSTLPVNSQVTTQGRINRIHGGSVAGANLFHSFREFSIQTGTIAWFDNPVAIENIITRVTGNSISNIDGILRANHSANLFLLNSNGILFGPNAKLEIGGSFVASTANRLRFADGGEFTTNDSNQTSPLLTVSVPLGLQFPNDAAPIQVQGTERVNQTLEPMGVGVGNTLALLGGDVRVSDRVLTAPGGRMILGGLARAGTIEINGFTTQPTEIGATFPAGVARGDVSIDDGAVLAVTAESEPGGELMIAGRNIEIAGRTQLLAGITAGVDRPNSQAGDIILDATGAIAIGENSAIHNLVAEKGTGDAGDIQIRAHTFAIADSSVDAGTFGNGDAGNILVQVNNHAAMTGNTQFYSNVVGSAIGNGGTIDIQAGTVSLTNGAKLEGTSNGDGETGNIRIEARDGIEIAGVGSQWLEEQRVSLPIAASGIFTNNMGKASGGNIEIHVPTGYLRIADGAVLSARSENDQPGGDITVNVDTLEITGGGQILTTAIAQGLAGDIVIQAGGSVRIAGFDPTYGDRYDQAVALWGEDQANDEIATNGRASSLQAASTNPDGQGSGNITIEAASLDLENGLLETSTASAGDAGDITIQVRDRITVENETAISSVTRGDGAGGNISLKADNEIAIANSLISSGSAVQEIDQGRSSEIEIEDLFQDAGSGNSGEILLAAGGTVRLSDGAELVTSTFAEGDGGDITINAGLITLTGNTYLITSSFGAGDGGDVFLQADDRVEIIDSTIFSDVFSQQKTAVGEAGFINIFANNAIAISNGYLTTESFGTSTLIATTNRNAAGTIFMNANTIEISNQTRLSAADYGGGFAGNVVLLAGDRVTITDSSLSSDANADNQSGGLAGFVAIEADRMIHVQNSSITAESFGSNLLANPAPTTPLTEQSRGAILFSAPHIQLNNQSILSTTIFSDGMAGDILIDADNHLTLIGGSQILSNSEGNGNAGNIEIDAAEIFLNNGTIEARTLSGDGGDIALRSRHIQLRQNSEITTSAGSAGGPGAGGDIGIDALTLVGLENSDITANAFEGAGGFIQINAEGIFGIASRPRQTPLSDITAFSQQNPSLSGEVAIESPDLDTSGLVEISATFIDVNDLIAQDLCQTDNEQDAFIITGRGGLPPNPRDQLTHSPVVVEWVRRQHLLGNERSLPSINPSSRRDRLIEAQGWVVTADGTVILTTATPRVTPQNSAWVNVGCSTFKGNID